MELINMQPKGCDKRTFEKVCSTIEQLALEIAELNGRLYVVGGAIRDTLMGRLPKDIDMEFLNIPHQKVFDILDGMELNPQYIGATFGIIYINLFGEDIEIAPARTEQKVGDLHTDFDVQFDVNSVEAASRRRDLTINSIYFDVLSNELIDCFDGIGDLKKGILSPVDVDTFAEDSLRILRAARYIARYGFKPSNYLWDAVVQCKDDIKHLSKERITSELKKIFDANHSGDAIRFLYDGGALDYIIPNVELDMVDFEVFNSFNFIEAMGYMLLFKYNAMEYSYATTASELLEFKAKAKSYFSLSNLMLDLTRSEKRVLLAMCMVNETFLSEGMPISLALFKDGMANGMANGYNLNHYYKNVLDGKCEIPDWSLLPNGKALSDMGYGGKNIQVNLVKHRIDAIFNI